MAAANSVVIYLNAAYVHLFELQLCLGISPRVGLLDHMVTLCLVFWEASILLSIVAAPTYTTVRPLLMD